METEIHTLNLEDVLFWPLPGVINFMDYEDVRTLTCTKEVSTYLCSGGDKRESQTLLYCEETQERS